MSSEDFLMPGILKNKLFSICVVIYDDISLRIHLFRSLPQPLKIRKVFIFIHNYSCFTYLEELLREGSPKNDADSPSLAVVGKHRIVEGRKDLHIFPEILRDIVGDYFFVRLSCINECCRYGIPYRRKRKYEEHCDTH